MKRAGINPLDEFLNTAVIDAASARLMPLKKVVRLAQNYTQNLQSITAQLKSATQQARVDPAYKRVVAEKSLSN